MESTAITSSLTNDFHGTLRRLRSSSPVAWIDELGGWLITSRELVEVVLRDSLRFTVDDPRFSTQQVVGPSMLSLDGAEHVRHRLPFESAFRRGEPELLRQRMRREADRLIADFHSQGHADLRTALAAPLAVTVMVDALGLVNVSNAELLHWYASIVGAVARISLGKEPDGTTSGAMNQLRNAIERSVLVSPLLLEATNSLELDEIVSNVAVLLFGGVETGESMTANALAHLVSAPGTVHRLRSEPMLVSAFVEESLRFEPPAAQLDRYATVDVELGGARIRRGDYVLCSIAAANRDPAHFFQPDVFDLDRPNAPANLSFARGPHACLASHVARAETEAAVAAVVESLVDVRWAALESWGEVDGIVFRKVRRVPVNWQV